MILDNSFTTKRYEVTDTAPKSIKLSQVVSTDAQSVSDEWANQVVEVDLNHHGLRKLQNLEK
jgi:hypothetical protein